MKKGDKIEFAEDLAVDHTVLRWGKPDGTEQFIRKGRYIVDCASADELWLANGDWAETGRVIYHSTKHGVIVKGRKSVEFLEQSARK